ncbi:VTT domain-containing protein [Paraburkholderia sp. MMS20-SJTN17]|uniref:VTT domain-containing protein n=1 Tax=Paraburkholderia translucens TaxID=2886945 RepID=A0ABS8KD41_9BURK|nr:VTT domain-containing protein [Paraburkholderia sp. MMS20-SJTN17]MCC8402691.1 VTT domain-containing protein [Paraburkholderia sp. MMS20-SJTN17]
MQFILRLEQDLEALLVQHGPLAYAIIGVIVFCSVGVLPLVILPADMLLFLSGALAAVGVLQPLWLAPVLVGAAVSGTVFNYALALAVATVWKPKRSGWIDKVSARTRALYARHGAALLLYSPFIAIVRAVAPALAGATKMPFRRFVRFAAGGAVIWICTLAGPGYFFGNVPWVRSHLPAAMAIVIGAGVVALVVSLLWRGRRKHLTTDPTLSDDKSRCD